MIFNQSSKAVVMPTQEVVLCENSIDWSILSHMLFESKVVFFVSEK